jgi:hypothetical protein
VRLSTRTKLSLAEAQRARNRHSDNRKFSNDLNGPKAPKMSERPLKTLRDSATSKLNTRVRFPSPAPANNAEKSLAKQQFTDASPLSTDALPLWISAPWGAHGAHFFASSFVSY